MHLVQHELPTWSADLKSVSLHASRSEIAKRRWRGVAEDGAEFGFDLERPLAAGSVFFQTESTYYVLVQEEEAVLELDLAEAPYTARLAWMLGNLHMGVEITGECMRVVDDQAVRQLFDREGVGYRPAVRLFRPLRGVAHAH